MIRNEDHKIPNTNTDTKKISEYRDEGRGPFAPYKIIPNSKSGQIKENSKSPLTYHHNIHL